MKDIFKLINGKICLMDQLKIIGILNEGIIIFATLMIYDFISTKFWNVIIIPSFTWINMFGMINNEHGISIIFYKKIHGLWYYRKMMWVLFSFWVLLGLCNNLPNSKKYFMEPKGYSFTCRFKQYLRSFNIYVMEPKRF